MSTKLLINLLTRPTQGETGRERLTLAHFRTRRRSNICYDRRINDNWAVVDAHLHPRPFGGSPVAFPDLIGRMRRAGILFTTLYGIGQRLPINSTCTYYLNCPGTPITPSLKNDFFNAQSVLDNAALLADDLGPQITLSMSFVDLHEPAANLEKMKVLQGEFPGMFKWVGEINLVKQALWPNSQGLPVNITSIKDWKPFMDEFLKQDIPLALHSDLGNEKKGLEFLPLMDEVLKTYPNNKIIWVHMAGLSKQLNPQLAAASLLQIPVTIEHHVSMIEERLKKYPKLSIDLSWDILYDELYSTKDEERPYVKLINKYPTRFLSGSDHLASADKTEDKYSTALSWGFIAAPLRKLETGANIKSLLIWFDLSHFWIVRVGTWPLRKRGQQDKRHLSRLDWRSISEHCAGPELLWFDRQGP